MALIQLSGRLYGPMYTPVGGLGTPMYTLVGGSRHPPSSHDGTGTSVRHVYRVSDGPTGLNETCAKDLGLIFYSTRTTSLDLG